MRYCPPEQGGTGAEIEQVAEATDCPEQETDTDSIQRQKRRKAEPTVKAESTVKSNQL
jgi:hypothetical protein